MHPKISPSETKRNGQRKKSHGPSSITIRHAFAPSLALAAGVGVLLYSAFADAPQPILKISTSGSNQFSITITNGLSTTNYTLFWRYALQDELYPWIVQEVGNLGQSNFGVNGGLMQQAFFRALLGSDADGDGVLEPQDAQPLNPNVGLLSVTIDSPVNGALLK